MARDRFEASDADPRLTAVLAAGAGIFLIVAPLVLGLVYVFPRHDALSDTLRPPQPRLQVSPADELAGLRASEDAELTSYGWIDRPNSVVRVPIGRAMELTAQRGIAGWSESRPDPQIPPRAGTVR
ncbi:MAG: hypothetical protein JWR80_2956 [Bradyrhizobium sp.]|nr:hypothetical protein [Bradyrhizobium sp.]